jgi:fumarate reductase flavoprotein subunit
MTQHYDILVIGAGAAGLPAAIFAAEGGASVLVVEAADKIGGTFHLSSGQMSAAGTRLQAAKGIHDTPQLHYDDIMRISKNTANPDIVRLAVENAADTLHWLMDNGFEPLPDHPVIHFGHEPYLIPRTYWGKDEGRSVLGVIAPLFEKAVASGAIELWLETSLVRLTKDKSGGVTGAVVKGKDGEIAVSAASVILASGGYSANAALFPELSAGNPLYGGGYPYSQGDGLKAAVELGGHVVNKDKFLPTFAGVEEPDAPGGITFATITYPQYRQPWEVYVDLDGNRFVQEDNPNVDERERALLKQPQLTFWAIYDEAIRQAAPSFFTTASQEEVLSRFGKLPGYQRADTLAELAVLTGIDEANLTATIAAYNKGVETGAPDPMGREHRPLPVAKAPFYAIRHYGWSIVGFAGLSVDSALRVLNAANQPIPNLYAAGEVMGLGATSGNAFVGGMSVTPAMTFGRLIGQRLGMEAKSAVAAE